MRRGSAQRPVDSAITTAQLRVEIRCRLPRVICAGKIKRIAPHFGAQNFLREAAVLRQTYHKIETTCMTKVE